MPDVHEQDPMAAMTTRIAMLRAVADGRREYAAGLADAEANPVLREQRSTLLIEAATMDAAVRIMEGDDGPLYGLLPSWRWTEEMDRALLGTMETPTGE